MSFKEPINPAVVIAIAVGAFAFAILVFVAVARGIDDISPYACNPVGTEAWINGRLLLNAPAGQACANLTLQAGNPAGRVDGDLWLVHTTELHRLCYRNNDADYCLTMEATP